MTVRSRGRATWLIGVVLFALLLAACGDDAAAPTPDPTTPAPTDDPDPGEECETPGLCDPPQELIEAAQAEGELVTFSSISSVLQEQFADAFEARYGVRVDFAQVRVAEAIERFQTEFEAGAVSVDFMTHSDDLVHEEMARIGAYATLDPADMPNLEAIVDNPDQYKETFAFWGGPAWALAWNTELVPPDEVPDGWCDLTDPKWQGRIGLVDQPGGSSIYSSYILMEEVCGEGLIEELAEQDIVWYTGVADATAGLIAGEIAVTNVVVHVILGNQADGAPVDVKGVPGMAIGARWFAIPVDAPNPNAARLFANWLLSAEAQQIAYSGQQGLSVLPDDLVPDTIVEQPLTELARAEQFTPDRVAEIRARFGLA